MRNQIIKNAPLPIKFWKLHSVGLVDSTIKHNLPDITDFDSVEFLQKKKDCFYLVLLERDGIKSLGHVMLRIELINILKGEL